MLRSTCLLALAIMRIICAFYRTDSCVLLNYFRPVAPPVAVAAGNALDDAQTDEVTETSCLHMGQVSDFVNQGPKQPS